MQFTLRDFLWGTVVIGLTIGIVIEHNDVRQLKGQAQWWEDVARKFAEALKMHGFDVEIKDEQLAIAWKQENNFASALGGLQVPTEDAWLTGHGELDRCILQLVILCLILLAGYFVLRYRVPGLWNRKHQPQAIGAWRTWLIVGLVCFAASIVCFVSRAPFTGTMLLTMAALNSFLLINKGFRNAISEAQANPEVQSCTPA